MKQGLRQNFIVKQRPEGTGELKVTMKLRGDLKPALLSDGKLAFHSTENAADVKLYYDELKVWDARNQPLAAHLELDEKSKILAIDSERSACRVSHHHRSFESYA